MRDTALGIACFGAVHLCIAACTIICSCRGQHWLQIQQYSMQVQVALSGAVCWRLEVPTSILPETELLLDLVKLHRVLYRLAKKT
jgi:hypothetical protein